MVSTADVKRELSFGSDAVGLTDSEFDALLDDLVGRETDRVADEIDVALSEETVTEDLARPETVDEWDLPLPNRPVNSVVSVEIDTDRVGGKSVSMDDIIVTETHLELKPSADRRRWPTERRSVTVEWSHGYPDGDEPEPVAAAIIGLVRQALQEIDADGIDSESIDGQSVTYELADAVVGRHLGRAHRFDEPDYYGGANVI